MAIRVADSADVASDAVIGDGSFVWHLAQVREGAVLGTNCIIGRGAYVGSGVRLGNSCKVQNYALVYEPAAGVTIRRGASIGARAVSAGWASRASRSSPSLPGSGGALRPIESTMSPTVCSRPAMFSPRS